MQSGESTAIAGLDAYLDAVSAGGPDAAILALVESDLAAADNGLRALDDTPHPDAAFIDRLEASLLRAAPPSLPSEAAVPRFTGVSNHPTRTQVLAPAPRRRLPGWPWAREQLATAALLVLTLVGSYLAFGAVRLDPERQQAPSIPLRDNERDILVEMPLSRDAIPDPFDLKVVRFRLEPDREAIVTADDWLGSPGTSVAYVLAGQLTLRAEAPFRIIRADAAPQEVPAETQEVSAETEVMLEIGDAAMFAFETTHTYANRGPEPVDFLQGNLIASRPRSAGSPPGLYDPGQDLASGGLTSLPASAIPATLPGPLVLRLERLDVESPEFFPPSSAQGRDGVQATLLEPAPPGAPSLDGQPQTAYILSLAPALSSPGAPGLNRAAP
jgi:hypothetical protein